MITLSEFDGLRSRYAAMPMTGLRVTVQYKFGVLRQSYDLPTLDGLLAAMVVLAARKSPQLPDTPEAYDIPLPLQCLWRDERGHPLWAASYFWPEGQVHQSALIVHKRAISGKWSQGKMYRGERRLRINTAAGVHKERQTPVAVETCVTGRYHALCIGNADAIAELLEPCSLFSGRRNIGLGEVDRFRIEPVEIGSEDCLSDGDLLLRAVPADAAHLLTREPAELPSLVGWTPPQWKATLFSPGWRAGTAQRGDDSEVDWFGAV